MATPCISSNGTISGCNFTQWLVDEQPVYDPSILEDIRPEDQWMLHVEEGVFEANSGVSHTYDRFNHVWPNVTKQWVATQYQNCIGTPCDKIEHQIAWGSTRATYFLEEQSWASPLLCFDQEMHVTHSIEQFDQIITRILKPATSAIISNFARKRVAQNCQQQFIANRFFGRSSNTFAYQWVVIGDEEIYIDTNAPATSVFKLTPQMLQRRVDVLMGWGYFGRNPFKDMPPSIELVTDLETCWDLDKLGGQAAVGSGMVPSIGGNWRFEKWDDANKFWAYNFSGTIGNFVIRVDPLQLRFNFVGQVGANFRYQLVLPFFNIPSSGAGGAAGLKDIPNPDFFNALYAFSIVWHRKGGMILVAEAKPINSQMDYGERNFRGRWQFVKNNLGADANGVAIENKRGNKGQFIGDFKMAYKPEYNELTELYFHKREPMCVTEINTCSTDPGYPSQSYSSRGIGCDGAIIVD